MKLEETARNRIHEDAGVVRSGRVSIALYKERLYRGRPRVEGEQVDVEHGAPGDGAVERLRKRRALERQRPQPAGEEKPVGASREVEKTHAAHEGAEGWRTGGRVGVRRREQTAGQALGDGGVHYVGAKIR